MELTAPKIFENQLPDELKKMSRVFLENGAKLYIVGGFVRDLLMKRTSEDIDLASGLAVEKVAQILKFAGFETKQINKRLGTVQIFNKKGFMCEYTTFRKESYPEGGAHTPSSVEFIDSLEEDARRRDFTINAIYYDIIDNKIIDFYNGVADINAKIVRAIETPEHVFENDGLRILRMVRFASTLMFRIENDTLNVARQMVVQLADISRERIAKEMDAIFSLSNAGSIVKRATTQDNPILTLYDLVWLGAVEFIFPDMFDYVPHEIFYERFAIFEKRELAAIGVYEILIALLYLFASLAQVQFSKLDEFTKAIFGKNGLMLNSKTIKEYSTYIKAVFESFVLEKQTDKFIPFIQKYPTVAKRVCVFRTLLISDPLNAKAHDKIADRLNMTIEYMKKNNIPFSTTDLKVSGTDILDILKINACDIPSVQKKLFEFATKNCANTKTLLLKELKKMGEKKDD